MSIEIKYNLDENPIKILNYSNNRLTKLPQLPDSLQELHCYCNKLTELPKLPNSLQRLSCNNNKLKILPELPNSFHKLDCWDNQFIKNIKYKYLQNIIY